MAKQDEKFTYRLGIKHEDDQLAMTKKGRWIEK